MRRTTHFLQFVGDPAPVLPFQPLGTARVVDQTAASVRLQCGPATTVEVALLEGPIARVGLFGDGRPPRYESVAVPEPARRHPQAQIDTANTVVHLRTADLQATIELAPLRISFHDASGRTLAADDPALGMGFAPLGPALVDPLGAPARVYKQHLPATRYFGCGERTGGLDKTGSHQVFWNTDPPSGHTAALNNLYTSVPFVLALQDGWAWGLFVDNPGRVEFDLANEAPDRCGFATDCGPLIYYVLPGPSPRAVLEQYTALSGRIPMPPRWALGYHQSRWGYRSADELRDLARTFREQHLPLDALYLDIDYMDGFRVFTWDAERFPDPAGLVADLGRLGVKLVTIVDPGVKVDETYPVYRQGRASGAFCTSFTGAEYHNVVWPGLCAFPDFLNARVRTWWGDLQRDLVEAGVAGIWCDMNEPTAFVPTPQTLPPDVTHQADDQAVLHAQVHNAYGQLMARAAREGLERLRPERRPFVISRAGTAGLQRYAIHWTGDNSSWWEHLWMSMPQLQNLGLSGYAWVGVDIGGFAGDATGELLTRWMEFGIFQPFCRNHSSRDTRRQEPWAFGEPYTSYIRALLELRQCLLPYLYTLFEEAHRTGAPILRPLLFEWPDDAATYATDDEFLLGPALLVAPIARPGTEHRHVYLPAGTWVHYWSGTRHVGPAHLLAHAPLGQPAIYVRANTPLPLWPPLQHDGERPPEPLTWLVYPAQAEPGTGALYDDAGDGYAQQDGAFARTSVRCAVRESIELEFAAQQGSFSPPSRSVELDLRGIQRPSRVQVDGQDVTDWHHTSERLLIRLPATPAARRVEITAALRDAGSGG